MRFQSLAMLHLFWLLPVFAAILLYGARQRRQALARFASPRLRSVIEPPARKSRRLLKGGLLLGAVCLLVIGLGRPAWNEKEITISRQGRDVVFLLDVSRSMLAEDLHPNRLQRAKLAIADCLETLSGDRVALVVFAGEARLLCPLTLDYGFFRQVLDTVTTDSAPRGGTMLGDALRYVLDEVFDERPSQYRDIICITDGGDQGSFPVEAARKAGERGIRCIIIGLGDDKEGVRIPVTDNQGRRTFLRYQGREVWTRLDAATLRQMAGATPGGRYLPVATGAIDLGQVYRQLIATARQQRTAARHVRRYEEKFQIFLGIAFFLLLVEALLQDWRPKRPGMLRGLLLFPVAALSFALSAPPAHAASVTTLVQRGNQAFTAGDFTGARQFYNEAAKKQPDNPVILFNQGAALHKAGKYENAAGLFALAAEKSRDNDLRGAARYNEGTSLLRQADAMARENPNQALDLYRKSAAALRAALQDGQPEETAGRNLELANRGSDRLRKQLARQHREQQKKTVPPPKTDPTESAINDLRRQQEQLNRQTADQNSGRRNAGDLARRQQQLARQTEAFANKLNKGQDSTLRQAARQQRLAARLLERNEMQAARRHQEKAAQLLGQAAKNDNDKKQNMADHPQQSAPPDQPATAAPVGEMAAGDDPARTILNAERQRRRTLLPGGRPTTVDKDW